MHSLIAQAFVVLFGLVSMLSLPALADGAPGGGRAALAPSMRLDEARAAIDSGNLAAALPMLVQLTRTEPANAEAWGLLANAYEKLNLPAEAQAALDIWRGLAPEAAALPDQGAARV